MNELILQHPDAGLYTAPFDFVNAQSQPIRNSKPMKSRYSVSGLLAAMLSLELHITATGYVFETAKYKQAGGIPLYPNLFYSAYALWISISSMGYSAVSEAKLFSFRIHTITSQTTKPLVYLEALKQFTKFLKKQLINQGDFETVSKEHLAGYVQHYGQMITQ